MTTRRETILAAIATALTGTTGVSTRIYRSRVEPITKGESPALVIEPLTDTATQNTSLPTLDWAMTVITDEIAESARNGIFSRIKGVRVPFSNRFSGQ